jgi:hypothetical protein
MSAHIASLEDIVVTTAYGKSAPVLVIQHTQGSLCLDLERGEPCNSIEVRIQVSHREIRSRIGMNRYEDESGGQKQTEFGHRGALAEHSSSAL